jgi:hypothetical protein
MFSVVGVLIVSSRPENGVGRLFCAIGLVNAAWIFTLGYAVRAVTGHANWLPAGQAAAWLDNVVSVPGQWLLLPVFFLFPTGRALSSRWLRLIWVGALAMAVGTVAAALEPGPVAQIEGVENPLGIASLHGLFSAVDVFLGFLQALLAAAGVACLIVRFRRGDRLERVQLKWFAYASGAALLMLGVLAVQSVVNILEGGLADGVFSTLLFLAVVAIPVAVGAAVLRYRLYDIDVVINRTLVYGALTATLAGASSEGAGTAARAERSDRGLGARRSGLDARSGGAVPPRPRAHSGDCRPALLPAQVRRRPDARALRRTPARRGGPRRPESRAAVGGRGHDAACARFCLAASAEGRLMSARGSRNVSRTPLA